MTVNWDRALTETKSFFRSGLFYILLGCLFLGRGYHLSGSFRAHSGFVFIVVILGVALVLYGTGTNATGEGTSGQIKVAIAGGAGVLALLLGYTVIEERKGLVEVFKRQRDYGFLDLTLARDSSIPVDLSSFNINARLSGRVPLPLWNGNQTIEILVPIPEDESNTEVVVELTPKPGFHANYVNEAQTIAVNWSTDTIDEVLGFTNEKIRVFKKSLDPIKPQELKVQPVGDKNSNASGASFTISPQ